MDTANEINGLWVLVALILPVTIVLFFVARKFLHKKTNTNDTGVHMEDQNAQTPVVETPINQEFNTLGTTPQASVSKVQPQVTTTTQVQPESDFVQKTEVADTLQQEEPKAVTQDYTSSVANSSPTETEQLPNEDPKTQNL